MLEVSELTRALRFVAVAMLSTTFVLSQVPARETWRPAGHSREEKVEFDPADMDALAADLVRACVPALSLVGCSRVRDEDLLPLTRARDLRSLALGCGFDGPALTDAVWPIIAQMPELEDLDLFRQYAIAGRGLASLSACQKLRLLRLSCPRLVDEGLRQIEDEKKYVHTPADPEVWWSGVVR